MRMQNFSALVFATLLGGCAINPFMKPMTKVIEQCASNINFDSHADCIRATYAREGRASLDHPEIAAFFRNVDAVKFLWSNKLIATDEAKSAIPDIMRGVQQSGASFESKYYIYKQEIEYVQIAADVCLRMGFARGTSDLNQCIAQQQNQRADLMRQRNQNILSGESLRLMQQQQSMQMMQQGLQMMSPPQPVISPTITCTRMPGSYTTTCR